MIFTGIRYILVNTVKINKYTTSDVIVSNSASDSMEKNRISQAEKVSRLHIADDLFYLKGKIKEVIVKTTDGKRYILYQEHKNRRRV